jgi:hypothetical protein
VLLWQLLARELLNIKHYMYIVVVCFITAALHNGTGHTRCQQSLNPIGHIMPAASSGGNQNCTGLHHLAAVANSSALPVVRVAGRGTVRLAVLNQSQQLAHQLQHRWLAQTHSLSAVHHKHCTVNTVVNEHGAQFLFFHVLIMC